MKPEVNIVVLDTNRFFSIGLEYLLKEYFINNGYIPVFLSETHYTKADFIFQSYDVNQVIRHCYRIFPRRQHLIIMQHPEKAKSFHRLQPCLSVQSTISRRIGVDELLLEIGWLMIARPKIVYPLYCPRCAPTLTRREGQVLLAINNGKLPHTIAKDLCLSIKTVSNYKRAAMHKLGLQKNHELYNWLRNGGLDNELKIDNKKINM